MATPAERLRDFLDGRTVGLNYENKLQWRGQGYDDGWIEMTVYEQRRFMMLIAGVIFNANNL